VPIESADIRPLTACRLCGGSLALGLSLRPTPIANELLSPYLSRGPDDPAPGPPEVFPLDVMVCDVCAHVQLGHVVDKRRLFQHKSYPYRSGATAHFVRHLSLYAKEMIERFRPKTIVEIGSNDGTMQAAFRDLGVKVIGVEPSDAARVALEAGHLTHHAFFDRAIADHIRETAGPADLIIANHVFAHVDDLGAMTEAIRSLLGPKGVFVFEVGYLPQVLEGHLFDTMYHEHLSYHHLLPLARFFRSQGLLLFDAELVETQGGAVRCFVSIEGESTTRGMHLCGLERTGGFGDPERVRSKLFLLEAEMRVLRTALRETLDEFSGRVVAGYGAPAKAVSFLYQMDVTLAFVVEDNPAKQGLCLPTPRPTFIDKAIVFNEPDAFLVLAWNFASEIMHKHRDFRGTWIVPLPELRVIECKSSRP